MRIIPLILVIALISPWASAALHEVPTGYATIQDAIDAASSGDMVRVMPGAYVENIDFKGKDIHLVSAQGPDVTIIDANQTGSAVVFQTGETAAAVLSGFTLTNGTGFLKKGFYYGGGVYAVQATPTIVNNRIVNNTADGGGGVFINYQGFSALNTVTLRDNVISNNTSTFSGGGVYCSKASVVIENNLIHHNTANSGGGGVGFYSATVQFNGNTITDNDAVNYTGGVFILKDSIITGVNNIVWGNICVTGYEAYMRLNSTFTIDYSNIGDGMGDIFVETGCTLNYGANMLGTDPMFVDAPNSDYHLTQAANPCVDSGSDTAINLGYQYYWTRTDAEPDLVGVDMGFHYGPSLFRDLPVIYNSTGGVVNFHLKTTPDHHNKIYIILGSVTGTAGVPLPSGLVLPINWDIFTDVMTGLINSIMFPNFGGPLNATGEAYAQMNTLGPLPPGTGIGLTVTFAWTFWDTWDYVSNPVSFTIEP